MAAFMSISFPTIVILTITVFLVYLLYRNRRGSQQAPANMPPGPSGWPYFGSLPTFINKMVFQGKPMEVVFDELAKQYGPVYYMNVFGIRLVVANTAETIKEILHHPDMNNRPAPGPKKSAAALKMYAGATGVLYSSGDAWRDQRRFSLSVLRGFGVGKKSFESHIATEADYLIEEIHSFKETPFDPSSIIPGAVSNVINTLTFGRRFEYSDLELKKLIDLINQRMENSGKEFLVLSAPFLLQLPFGPGHAVKTTIAEIRQRIGDIVEEHKSTYDPENHRDFIDAYLGEVYKDDDDETKSIHFTNKNLVQMVEDLFVGGTQTTTTTLSWALLYLVAFPSIQEKIQQEIDDTCGRNRFPTMSDKRQLPYLLATIHELQRHTCILYILGVRMTYEVETTIGGYAIPSRTVLLQNIWSVSKDPSVWGEDVLEFKPERFLDEDNHVIKRDEHLIFGAGRRSCMGENIAKMELFIFLSHILHRYTLLKGDEEINLKPKAGGVLKPHPYKIRAIER
ncbi:cytochrome P450 2J4-like [Amphiura filiformis]|uniref:cytochrome P450 2J4-like n=1 Tax=Amphiura filiformis TaxID=82378 RepID=UPI003B210CB4